MEVAVNRLYDVAQLIVSSWVLASKQEGLPTSHGVLDRALRVAHESGSIPGWADQELHFTDSRTGLRCIELPAILEWAQNSELTNAPNPSYKTAHVKVSDRVARAILRALEVPDEQAAELGRVLVEQAKVTA